MVIRSCHHDTQESVLITNNFEEVLILGSLEERGLPGHLAQVAPLAVEFDTLQDNPGLSGLALLIRRDEDNCPVTVGDDSGNTSFIKNIHRENISEGDKTYLHYLAHQQIF